MRKFSCIAALAGLLFGYDTGIISAAVFFIKLDFTLSLFMTEVVVAAILFGAILGSISSGYFANNLSRRKMLKIDAIIFIISTLCSALSPTVWLLIISRIGVGFGIGIACYIAPLYISEIAATRVRGRDIALNTIAVTGGIFLSYLIGFLLSPTESWRLMLGLGVLPATCLLIGVHFLPESPRWLIVQGKLEEAKALLYKIRESKFEAEFEMVAIQNNLKEPKALLKDLYTPAIRRVLLIGVVLAVMQVSTGINTILYYAPFLFQAFGFKSVSSLMLLTLAVGFINFIMTILVMLRVDKVGRKRLLLQGLAFMTLSLVVLSITLRCDANSPLVVWIMVSSLFVFIAAYASSIGAIFWIVIAEIYPLRVRGLAMGIASCSNWTANLIITLTFLQLLNAVGPSNTFLLYASICFGSFFFCFHYLPETMQHSLEEIESKIVDVE